MSSQSWTGGLAEYRTLCVDIVRLLVDIYVALLIAIVCGCRKVGYSRSSWSFDCVRVKLAVYDYCVCMIE